MTARSKAEPPDWRVSMMSLLWSVLVTTICVALLFWLALKLGTYVYSQWRATSAIAVGTFTTAGLDANVGDSTGKALSARLDRLRRYARSASSFGLVKTPALISAPNLVKARQRLALQRLEQLDLKVHDVSVNQLVKSLTTLLEPSYPTLAGTVTDYGDSLEISAELKWKDDTLCAWVASRLKPDDVKADNAKIGSVLNGLYDDLLSQVLFDLPGSDGKWCSETPAAEPEFRNWQHLQAVTLGLESLISYQSTLEPADLTRAIGYLKRIPTYAPDYALGHYFYGVALSEDRQEQLAASMFHHTQWLEEAASKRAASENKPEHPKELQWNARLQRAASMVEEYDASTAADAVEILRALSTELQQAAGTTDGNADFAHRLLPFAQARLAYAYGTQYRLDEAVTEQLKNQAEKALEDADSSFEAVPKWDSKKQHKWPSKEQQDDVLSWVRHAEGYARFRIAQWEYESGTAKGDQSYFMDASKKAENTIREALSVRPTNYLFWHSLAIIVDDDRLDPKNERLDEAERIYQRTVELVPQDYYQYERLARIYWRRAKAQKVQSARWRELVAAGLKHVEDAEARRKQSPTPTTVVCGTFFLAAKALIETEQTKKTEALRATIGKADQTITLGALTSPQRSAIGEDAADLMNELAKAIPDPPNQPSTEQEKAAANMKKDLSDRAKAILDELKKRRADSRSAQSQEDRNH